MKNPLPYDTVEPVKFEKLENPLFKHELRQRSAARVVADPEFGYIMEDLTRVKKRLAENKLSLNIEKRRAEIEEEKARKEKRTAERAARQTAEEKRYAVTLDTVDNSELQLVTSEKKNDNPANVRLEVDPDNEDDPADEAEGENGNKRFDAVRNETISILADLLEFTRSVKTPATASTQPLK